MNLGLSVQAGLLAVINNLKRKKNMEKSDSIKELATALAKAQGEFSGAVKDANNPFFKSKYADLESVVAAIKPSLAKHGLSYIQISHDTDKGAAMETVIMHSSGEWISAGIVSVPVSKQDAQGYGSAMTYARRYSLSAAFGIAPEDDDGNAAAKAPANHIHKPTDNHAFIPDEEEVIFLSSVVDSVIAMKEDYAQAAEYLEKQLLDNDQKTWVWSKLDSKIRSGIKKVSADKK